MAAGTVMKDVYTSLAAVLQANVSELASSQSITSQSPSVVNAGPGIILSIFPFQVRHNQFLANELPVREGLTTMRPAPLALDVYYAFTPFSTTEFSEATVVEKIVSTFHDYPVLRGDDLKGNLVVNGNEELKIVPVEMSTDDTNKLWSLFSKPYKTFVSFMVTPVRIASSRTSQFTRVIEKGIDYSRIG